LVLCISGTVGGFIFFITQTLLLKFIDEIEIFQFDTSLFYGFFIGVSIFIILNIQKKFDLKNYSKFSISGFISLIFVGIISMLYIFGDNTILTGVFFTLFFSVFILIGSNLFSRSNLVFLNNVKSIVGAAIGGGTAGIFIAMIYVLKINFSIDEGFFLLTTSSLVFFGIIIGGVIFTSITIWNLITKKELKLFSKNQILSFKNKIGIVLLIGMILFGITSFKYWDTLNLNDETVLFTQENNQLFYECGKINNQNETRSFAYNKEMLIKYLKDRPEQNIDILFYLYYLSDNDDYGLKFKELLLDEVKNKKFIGISNSVKAWQFQAMHRAYYYDLLIEKNNQFFTPEENELILDWFREINEHAYKITWVSYAYGFINKKLPEGPYENQEIGIGLLSILSEILKDKYPELAKRNLEYVDKYGIGWKYNFRNPDDQIVYAQQTWQKNAFMMAKYGGHEEYLRGENSKASFEWVMLQWPPNGMAPAYDVPVDWTPFDTMILGSYLHEDGRYLWVAEKMLEKELENEDRKIDLILGLENFDNIPYVQKPDTGSCYIEGTIGTGLQPKGLMPDKIVLRDGWNEDSLYALLNMRFSGWHSYKATNSFISIMYGEPFVVEKLDLERHDWLPKGKADHRDKKIERSELNGFILETKGLEEIVNKITGHGSSWHQDPPKFAEKSFMYTTENADFIKTKISDWHGWEHNRISILVKDGYIVVLDNAHGNDSRTVGITWNLKGNPTFKPNSIELIQEPYAVNVHYPHIDENYLIKIIKATDENNPAGSIHDPDLTLFILAEQTTIFGTSTLFIPDKNYDYKVERIKPIDDKGEKGFPKVLGIKIINSDYTDIIGASFESNEYTYEQIKTDADVFFARYNSDSMKISFGKASYFEIFSEKEPTLIEFNGNRLDHSKEWSFINKIINIPDIKEGGDVKITFN